MRCRNTPLQVGLRHFQVHQFQFQLVEQRYQAHQAGLDVAAFQFQPRSRVAIDVHVGQFSQPALQLGSRRRHAKPNQAVHLMQQTGQVVAGDQPAMINDADPRGQGLNFLDIVARVDNAHALAGQALHFLENVIAIGDPRPWWVRPAAAGAARAPAPCQVEPALHSARKTLDPFAGAIGQPDRGQHLVDAPLQRGAARPYRLPKKCKFSRAFSSP